MQADGLDRPDEYGELRAVRGGADTDAGQALQAEREHANGPLEVPAVRPGAAADANATVPADLGDRPDQHIELPAVRAKPDAELRQAVQAGCEYAGRPDEVPAMSGRPESDADAAVSADADDGPARHQFLPGVRCGCVADRCGAVQARRDHSRRLQQVPRLCRGAAADEGRPVPAVRYAAHRRVARRAVGHVPGLRRRPAADEGQPVQADGRSAQRRRSSQRRECSSGRSVRAGADPVSVDSLHSWLWKRASDRHRHAAAEHDASAWDTAAARPDDAAADDDHRPVSSRPTRARSSAG